MSGRKPRILQFASDAVAERQRNCDANKCDGDLHALIRLCSRDPAAPHRDAPWDWSYFVRYSIKALRMVSPRATPSIADRSSTSATSSSGRRTE